METRVFMASSAFILYVLLGYPLLLALLARVRGRPALRRDRLIRTVTIVLVVRNGGRWVRRKIESIAQLDYLPERTELLVVSDGSTDNTEQIVEGLLPSLELREAHLLRTPAGGKAAALNEAMRRASGDILFFTDVRQELEPRSLRRLVECFADPSVGAASGELIIRGPDGREDRDVGLYWRYEKWIRKNLSRLDSVPGTTGCIYAMRRKLVRPLPPDTLLDDVYLPLNAFFRGYRVVLDSRAKAFDEVVPLGSEYRRKMRTLAGVYQILGAYPALLGPTNRMWIHFVSHKLGRLLLPFALLTLAVSSVGLAAPWMEIALGSQAAFYGLAALDRWVPERWFLKMISSPARTFTVLMAAALGAASILFTPARRFWKEPRPMPARFGS